MMKDTDLMPWGAHKGKAMANVPAKYLLWLYSEGLRDLAVKAYIEDNLDVLKKQAKTNG